MRTATAQREANPIKPRHNNPCPCGRDTAYAACCGALHASLLAGGPGAASAEALMRSRYSAYVRGNAAYLLATWHPSTRPAELDLAADAATRWLGLDVRRAHTSGDSANVEFVARYKIGGRAHRLHEISRFLRENGQWFYVDGEFPTPKDSQATVST